MNVYIYSDSPYPLTKSIDIRGKTISQIQAEGRGGILGLYGSYTLDSNGLSVSAQNNEAMLYYVLPKALNTSNKVTLKYTGSCTSAQDSIKYGGLATLGITNNLNTGWNDSITGQYHSGYNQSGGITGITFGTTNLTSAGPQNTAGNIDETFVVDLSTGVCTLTITSPVSHTVTYTLSSAQISSILGYGNIFFRVSEWTSNYYMRLYTASIEIV